MGFRIPISQRLRDILFSVEIQHSQILYENSFSLFFFNNTRPSLVKVFIYLSLTANPMIIYRGWRKFQEFRRQHYANGVTPQFSECHRQHYDSYIYYESLFLH